MKLRADMALFEAHLGIFVIVSDLKAVFCGPFLKYYIVWDRVFTLDARPRWWMVEQGARQVDSPATEDLISLVKYIPSEKVSIF